MVLEIHSGAALGAIIVGFLTRPQYLGPNISTVLAVFFKIFEIITFRTPYLLVWE